MPEGGARQRVAVTQEPGPNGRVWSIAGHRLGPWRNVAMAEEKQGAVPVGRHRHLVQRLRSGVRSHEARAAERKRQQGGRLDHLGPNTAFETCRWPKPERARWSDGS